PVSGFETSGQARRGEMTLQWRKTIGSRSVEGLALWSLSLDLVSSTNRRRGVLLVRRAYSQRPLQLDINLLTTGFPTAIADALDRILQHTVQEIPHEIPEGRAFLTAQAG